MPLSTVVALAVVLQSVKSSAVPPSKERKVEKLLKAPLKKKKKKRERVRVYKEEKSVEHAHTKKNPRFSSLKKKKEGPGETVKPNYVRREEGKKKK